MEQAVNRTNLNLVTQLCRLIDSQIRTVDEESISDPERLEWMFVFCLTWSLGSCLKIESREQFKEMVKKISNRM